MIDDIQAALESETGRTFINHPKEYIGDGVYAFYDGVTLYICTMREHRCALHWIAMEPREIETLQKFLVGAKEEITAKMQAAFQKGIDDFHNEPEDE